MLKTNFWKSLIAVLAGNLLYFFLLYNHLPPKAQHQAGHLDLGLILDLWICLVFYGIVEFFWRRRISKTRVT